MTDPLHAALAVLARALAPMLAAELAKLPAASTADELCDRKSCPISKRAWDLHAGKPNGWPVFLDGRRKVALRADVLGWLTRERAIAPTVAHPAEDDQGDDADRALAAAGVRRIGGRR